MYKMENIAVYTRDYTIFLSNLVDRTQNDLKVYYVSFVHLGNLSIKFEKKRLVHSVNWGF